MVAHPDGRVAGDAAVDDIRRQRLEHLTYVRQPLVLCSQIRRSGGTLFTRLFDGHPECFVHPNELRWGRGDWPILAEPLTRPVEELFEEVREKWPVKFARSGYVKYPKTQGVQAEHPDTQHHPFLFDPVLQDAAFRRALETTGRSRPRDVLDAYLTSLFNAWLDFQNLYAVPKRRVIAFEPRFIAKKLSDLFFRDYPDGLIVTIVRDPRSWLGSYMSHTGFDEDKSLRLWAEYTQAALRLKDTHPDDVVVLLFEDLIRHTERVMRQLCNRLGLSFDQSLLRPTFNGRPALSDSTLRPSFTIDSDVLTRRGDSLSLETRRKLEHTAAPLYDTVAGRFGL